MNDQDHWAEEPHPRLHRELDQPADENAASDDVAAADDVAASEELAASDDGAASDEVAALPGSDSSSESGHGPPPATDSELAQEPRSPEEDRSDAIPRPEFGLLEVIEAFTAMRHECRLQVKENRELAQAIKAATAAIQSAEERLNEIVEIADEEGLGGSSGTLDPDFFEGEVGDPDDWDADDNDADDGDDYNLVDRGTDDDELASDGMEDEATESSAGAFVESLIDIDLRLAQTLAALERGCTRLQHPQDTTDLPGRRALAVSSQQVLGRVGWWRRWLVAPLFAQLVREYEQESRRDVAAPVAASLELVTGLRDGMALVAAQTRQVLEQYGVERQETLGHPFDGQVMRAIGTLPTSAYPAGSVAEELAPLYRRGSKVLRFALVRVAEAKPPE